MKRRQFLQVAGLSTTGIGASFNVHAQIDTKVKVPAVADAGVWQMVNDFPEELDIPRLGIETLASTLAAITDGAFRIELVKATEFLRGSESDDPAKSRVLAFDAVREGKAQIGYTSTGLYCDRNPIFAIGAGLPFSLNARQFNAWLLQQGGLELINNSYHPHGLHMLSGGNMGALMGGWSAKEINNVQDFAGRRVCALGLGGSLLARFGAQPLSLFPAEIALAFSQSRIDIAQWGSPHDDEKLGLNNHAPFYYYPGWLGSAQLSFLINLDAWNKLAKSYQAALTAAAAHAHQIVLASYDSRNASAIKRLVAKGTKLRPMPQSVLRNLRSATEVLTEEIASRNTSFKTLYDSVRISSADAYLWWQVAEYTYDNFMIRTRVQG